MKTVGRIACGVALSFTAVVTVQPPVQAYNSGTGVTYAEAWWSKRSSNFVAFGNDCANFVSQSLFNGGLKMRPSASVPPGAQITNTYWYNYKPTNAWSTAWSTAAGLMTFLISHIPGTSIRGISAQPSSLYTPSPYGKGDVVFYDWQNDGDIDHTSYIVGSGATDNAGYTGTYINMHTSDRHHQIWTLRPTNSRWSTTTYQLVHIPSSATRGTK